MSDYAAKAAPLARPIIHTARKQKKLEGAAFIEYQKENVDDPKYDYGRMDVSDRQRRYDALKRDFDAEVDSQFGWVMRMFMQYQRPDPDEFQPVIDSVKNAEKRLESGAAESHALTASGDLLVHWHGDFSTNLRNVFLNPIATKIPSNQALVISTLRNGLENYKKMLTVTQGNMLHIGHQTVNALEACTEKNGSDWSVGLAVLACLGAVGSATLTIPSGGTSLVVASATLATISASASLSQALLSPDGDIPLGADTVDAVMQNLIEAVIKLNGEQEKAERKISTVLKANCDEVAMVLRKVRKSGQASCLIPARPAVDGADRRALSTKFIPNQ